MKLFLTVYLLLVFVYLIAFIYYKAQTQKAILIPKPLISSLPSKTDNSIFTPSLTIDKIFQTDHSWTATFSAQKLTRLLATGDVIPSRSVNFNTIQVNDFTWAYKNTAHILKDADITFINLESPLLDNCPVSNEGMIFCGNKRHAEGLIYAGVDIVNLANNHLGNYGLDGITETKKILDQYHILYTGAHRPVLATFNQQVFAFLGYNLIGYREDGLSWADYELIKKDIQQLKNKTDIIIVAFHWGTEYTSQPTQEQIELGHFTIDNGADLVIGNHPHWIQPVEIYKQKAIIYAHGNFIFDQMWSEKTQEGIIGRYLFFEDKLIDIEFLPIKIRDYGQPYILSGDEKTRILEEMKIESLRLSNRV